MDTMRRRNRGRHQAERDLGAVVGIDESEIDTQDGACSGEPATPLAASDSRRAVLHQQKEELEARLSRVGELLKVMDLLDESR